MRGTKVGAKTEPEVALAIPSKKLVKTKGEEGAWKVSEVRVFPVTSSKAVKVAED